MARTRRLRASERATRAPATRPDRSSPGRTAVSAPVRVLSDGGNGGESSERQPRAGQTAADRAGAAQIGSAGRASRCECSATAMAPELMREASRPRRAPREGPRWDHRREARPCAWRATATEARRRQGRQTVDRQPPGRKEPRRSAPLGRRSPSACLSDDGDDPDTTGGDDGAEVVEEVTRGRGGRPGRGPRQGYPGGSGSHRVHDRRDRDHTRSRGGGAAPRDERGGIPGRGLGVPPARPPAAEAPPERRDRAISPSRPVPAG